MITRKAPTVDVKHRTLQALPGLKAETRQALEKLAKDIREE
jgi:hypothetical protein